MCERCVKNEVFGDRKMISDMKTDIFIRFRLFLTQSIRQDPVELSFFSIVVTSLEVSSSFLDSN